MCACFPLLCCIAAQLSTLYIIDKELSPLSATSLSGEPSHQGDPVEIQDRHIE